MNQAETERAIFLEFAPVCGLPISLESVENREPPEPDIVCSIDGRGIVGFELTELIDSGFMQRLNLMAKTKMHLSSAWRTELTEDQVSGFESSFGNALLNFVYEPQANLMQRQKPTIQALLMLLELPEEFEGTALRNVKNLSPLTEVSVRRGQFVGPILDVESAGWLGDPTAPAIRKKLNKTYECAYPIQLLAYIQIDLLPPGDAWTTSVDEAARALSSSQFEKIWVFDRSEGAVAYEIDA